MKRRLVLLAALVAAGCTQPGGTSTANVSGATDLVLVDQLAGTTLAARTLSEDGSTIIPTGMPGRYLFVTSTANNELRVQENVLANRGGRDWLRAPNPLESLSIPVLDRPTRLAADEGRNANNERVTGAYVYATRAGAEEVSVVSVARRRQLSGRPFATPAPVTDLAAWMDVDRSAPIDATPLPATTRLFVTTWDGDVGSLWMAELPTDSRDLDSLSWRRLVVLNALPLVAVAAVPPAATRTLDGNPFCAARGCVAYSVRRDGGRAGDVFVLDPDTGVSAPLDFGGPIRRLVPSEATPRLYGVLDEQACGSPSCGGVIASDVLVGTSAAGFPRAVNALGQPMQPMRSPGLITGVTLAANSAIQLTQQAPSVDGGSIGFVSVTPTYQELGAFGSTSGAITFFSGLAGSILDFDGRRTSITGATLRVPGRLLDGGVSFVNEDGGTIGTVSPASVETPLVLEETWRVSTVTAAGAAWTIDVSDGFFETQDLVAVYQGQLPGLVGLPTSAADGLVLNAAGLEGRAAVGDSVRFEVGNATDGFVECGRTTVASVGAGTLTVAEAPAGCEGRTRFTVRAGATRPFVFAGDLEGYLGRAGPGESLAYNRPYVLLPADVTTPRTSLRIDVPAEPNLVEEGAFLTFQLTDFITPYRLGLDASLGTCFTASVGQAIFGALALQQVPTTAANSTAVIFRTALFASVPSGNAVAEFQPTLVTRVGFQGTGDNVSCRR